MMEVVCHVPALMMLELETNFCVMLLNLGGYGALITIDFSGK
jgi:hypothetical protein